MREKREDRDKRQKKDESRVHRHTQAHTLYKREVEGIMKGQRRRLENASKPYNQSIQ